MNSSIGNHKVLIGIIILWFFLSLGSLLFGVFDGDGVKPALLLILYVLLPIGIFVVSYLNSVPLREVILSLNLRVVILAQTVRMIGGVFLILYGLGLLPALFALPAGLGDLAIGMTAPIVALVLLTKHPFPARVLILWNVLGILDLVNAVSLGILTSSSPLGIFAGEISIKPVISFPLGLIPTFGVPLTVILHVIALIKLKENRMP